MIAAGETFRFVRGDPHLWIVLSDPALDSARVLLVNVTSWRQDKDQTCLLNVGDHPFIQHNSCINYADAQLLSLAQLNHLISNDAIVFDAPLSPTLLELIRTKSSYSPLMKTGHFDLLLEQGLVGE